MKSRPIRHDAKASRRAGATTVGMAIVGPLLFLIVFGLFEVAYGFMVQHLIQDAARDGCRIAMCYRNSNAIVLATVLHDTD